MNKAKSWKAKLEEAQKGIHDNFAYITEVRNMHPNISTAKVNHLRAIWNGRAIQQPKHKDPFWGVKLLIDICHHVKNNIQK